MRARQLPVRLEDEPKAGTEKRVSALVTVKAPLPGSTSRKIVSETFSALVRTRLTWKGRPAFLAADPEENPERRAGGGAWPMTEGCAA